MLTEKPGKWFEEWFDSVYYHILYKHRNYDEAEFFINKLVNYLKPKTDAQILDLGCGKGRHAIYLHKKGFDVTGIDLSPESISYAKQASSADSGRTTNSLEFYIQDMRKPFRINYYDYVVNLFTSFGYFEKDSDNVAVINSVSKALKPKGIFILDFLNARKVIANLVEAESKTIDNIEFNISRHLENNFIIKNISFTDQGKQFSFQERVKAITQNDFEKYFAVNKLKILHLFGNYQLENFNENYSERLIILAQKE